MDRRTPLIALEIDSIPAEGPPTLHTVCPSTQLVVNYHMWSSAEHGSEAQADSEC
jgi:hypothetical protein